MNYSLGVNTNLGAPTAAAEPGAIAQTAGGVGSLGQIAGGVGSLGQIAGGIASLAGALSRPEQAQPMGYENIFKLLQTQQQMMGSPQYQVGQAPQMQVQQMPNLLQLLSQLGQR